MPAATTAAGLCSLFGLGLTDCVVNNTYVPQDTTIYTDSTSFDLHLEANEIRWYNL